MILGAWHNRGLVVCPDQPGPTNTRWLNGPLFAEASRKPRISKVTAFVVWKVPQLVVMDNSVNVRYRNDPRWWVANSDLGAIDDSRTSPQTAPPLLTDLFSFTNLSDNKGPPFSSKPQTHIISWPECVVWFQEPNFWGPAVRI